MTNTTQVSNDIELFFNGFIMASENIAHHILNLKKSTNLSEKQYSHTLCAKFYLIISDSFLKNIKLSKEKHGYKELIANSKEFQAKYNAFESWRTSLEEKGYYNYLIENKLLSSADQLHNKRSAMDKLKNLASDYEKKILNNFEGKPEKILDLYALTTTSENSNIKNLALGQFEVINALYINYCEPEDGKLELIKTSDLSDL